MTANYKVSGIWKTTKPYAKIGGAWQVPKSAWKKIGSSWKSWFLQSGVIDSGHKEYDNHKGFGNYTLSVIKKQADGKFVVGGNFTSVNGLVARALVRLNTDFTLDTTFGMPSNSVVDLAIQPDGKIIAVGSFPQTATIGNGVMRFNADGTPDTIFKTNTGIGTQGSGASAIALQSDGKILIGNSTFWNGSGVNRLVRLNTDGTRDTTFNIGTGFNNATALVAIRPDGKIIVHGIATSYNGVTTNQTTLLNSDGTRDASFAAPIFFGQDIAVQSDNKVIIGSNAPYTIGGVVYNRLIRLNANGSVDTTFNMGTGLNAAVQQVTVMPDGKIMLSGTFVTYNGATANRIIRLNADGTRDTTFNAPVISSSVSAFAVQSNGKIVIGGAFATVGVQTYNRIARLNADGTLDATFNIGTGFLNVSPLRMATFSDDKVIIATQTSTATYNGQFFGGVNRLNADGTLDTTFSNNLLGGNANGAVSNIRQQPDKKIVAVGSFAGFAQKPYYSWVRFGGEDA